jgi:hypothetical protein
MNDLNLSIETEIGSRILASYKKTIFGKVSKLELDLIVFSFLVKDILKSDIEIWKERNFNWFRINTKHIRRLSLQLKITETRVINLLEQVAIIEFDQENTQSVVFEEIIYLLSRTRQSKKDINEGELRIYIPNKITKSAIIAYLVQNNSTPDFSFNQNVLIIRFIDLLPKIEYDELFETLISIAEQSNILEKNTEFDLIKTAANKKTGLEKLQSITHGGLKFIIGEAGEFLSDSFFDSIMKLIKKNQ